MDQGDHPFSLVFSKPSESQPQAILEEPDAPEKKKIGFLRRLEGVVQLIQGQELPKTLDPDGDWRASFDLISLASGVYTMFATPFLLCLQQRVAPVFFLVTSGLADSSLLAHFLVSCVTGYRKRGGKGELVNDLPSTLKKYVMDGSFLLDLITSNPMVVNTKFLRTAHILRIDSKQWFVLHCCVLCCCVACVCVCVCVCIM
jgi:hypothetical protein